MSKQTQISLDFGPEEKPSGSTGDNGTGNDPTRHYMAAGGVGVRVKSYKQSPVSGSGGGDLFGDTAVAAQATPAEPLAPETSAMSGTTVPNAGTPHTNGRSEAASEAAAAIGPVEAPAEPVARYEPVTMDESADHSSRAGYTGASGNRRTRVRDAPGLTARGNDAPGQGGLMSEEAPATKTLRLRRATREGARGRDNGQ